MGILEGALLKMFDYGYRRYLNIQTDVKPTYTICILELYTCLDIGLFRNFLNEQFMVEVISLYFIMHLKNKTNLTN